MGAELVQLPPTNRVVVENVYDVPTKQWSRWSPNAQRVFNAVMDASADQAVMKHPKGPEIHLDHWQTLRWNYAWLAADATDGRL